MAWIGKSQGIFKLHQSDDFCGSFMSVDDAAEILAGPRAEIARYATKDDEGLCWVSELDLHRRWGAGDIESPHPPKVGVAKRSFDELILERLIVITFPQAHVEIQVPFGRKRLDLVVSVDGVKKGIEFLGPSHFIQQYQRDLRNPTDRKVEAEDALGHEVVLWPYWIQRCSSNIRALFDDSTQGIASVWSTKAQFGDFQLFDAAKIIDEITERFRALRDDGIGYMYLGAHTVKPIHPIVEQILEGKVRKERLIPRDNDRPPQFWLPAVIRSK